MAVYAIFKAISIVAFFAVKISTVILKLIALAIPQLISRPATSFADVLVVCAVLAMFISALFAYSSALSKTEAAFTYSA